MRERVTAVEDRIRTVKDQVELMTLDIKKKKAAHISALMNKANDLKNRRHNNLCLIGVSEKQKVIIPVISSKNGCYASLEKKSILHLFAVKRVHRVPNMPLPPGAPPQPVLV